MVTVQGMRRCMHVMLVAAVAACSSSDAPGSAQLPRGKSFVIGMIGRSATSAESMAGLQGAELAAAELTKSSGVAVMIQWLTPSSDDPRQQAGSLSGAVMVADAVLLSPLDALGIRNTVDAVVAKGVPVMTYESDVPDSQRFAFLGPIDAAIGAQVMDELAEQMGGKGRVAILAGNETSLNLQLRVQGVRDAAVRHKGISIVDAFHHAETPLEAADEVLRVMQDHPDVQGIAMIGGWALFDARLLTQLDAKRVKVVAVDAMPVELPYIESGIAPVLFAQPTHTWAYEAVKVLFDHVYLKNEVSPVRQMELTKVSRENLGTWARRLKSWGYDGIDPKYLAL